MSTRLAVEIDGTYVPLDTCDWVLWGPCGCPWGATLARSAPTEDAAWKEFYDRKRERDKAQRDGCFLEVMTHERWSREVAERMKTRCTHGVKGRAS
jgi:hypothetical protein